ncbi:MAG: hypothetical protein ISR02_05345 [Flavobacteriales bacterium]|nr:hypothetical protein [Flavobacteriales bacterium]
MKKLLLVLLCLPIIGFGQIVNIPDGNFKTYLLGDSLINTNGDTEIQISEANSFNVIIDWNGNLGLVINDLTGIEEFINLTELKIENNNVTNLDLSQNNSLVLVDAENNNLVSINLVSNVSLSYLDCSNNQLNNLDISQNTSLATLWCGGNPLGSLDVNQNTLLTDLNCSYNLLTSLDLSQNTLLTNLYCAYNQLTNLNLSNNSQLARLECYDNMLSSLDMRNGNNQNIWRFKAYNNQLICIDVDNPAYSTANWVYSNNDIDFGTYFDTNCSGTSIYEHFTKNNPIKVTDLLGRETNQTNQPLLYLYNDGTVEKRIVVE